MPTAKKKTVGKKWTINGTAREMREFSYELTVTEKALANGWTPKKVEKGIEDGTIRFDADEGDGRLVYAVGEKYEVIARCDEPDHIDSEIENWTVDTDDVTYEDE